MESHGRQGQFRGLLHQRLVRFVRYGRVRDRGIIDGSYSTTHARHLMQVQGKEIRIEGVILRDSSSWTMPIRQSERVTVKNVKLIGYRANSDGIDYLQQPGCRGGRLFYSDSRRSHRC